MKRISWKEYLDILEQLLQKIKLRNFNSIVGIGRGGCLLASYLASKMGIPLFYPVFAGHRVKQNQDVEIISESMSLGDISAYNKKKVILSISKPLISGTWFETIVIVNEKIVDKQKSKDIFD